MIMNEKVVAALLCVNASADQLRGFGETDADAMRDAVESERVAWQWDTPPETYADWRDITQDAKSAGMLTFHQTPYGALITDDTN